MAGRSSTSASGESKACFEIVDGSDRMQMLCSISYISLALPLPPSRVSNLLNHRKANPPFENIGPGMPLFFLFSFFFWPEVGLCLPASEVSLHTLGKKERKKAVNTKS